MSTPFRILLRILGISALIAGGLVVAAMVLFAVVLLGPLVFWFAWNVLDFASAVGLPELGFWGILLATAFLVVGWPGKVLITAVVFLADHPGSMAPDRCTGRRRRCATSSPSLCWPRSRHVRTRMRRGARRSAR
jgi:hypothetical protein